MKIPAIKANLTRLRNQRKEISEFIRIYEQLLKEKEKESISGKKKVRGKIASGNRYIEKATKGKTIKTS